MSGSTLRPVSRPMRAAARCAAAAILEPLEARRLLASGPFDTSFGGGDGYVLIQPFTELDVLNTVKRQQYRVRVPEVLQAADGRVYFGLTGGYQIDPEAPDDQIPVIGRLTASGELDTTWGTGGAAYGFDFRTLSALHELPSGELLAGGSFGDVEARSEVYKSSDPSRSGIYRVSQSAEQVARLGPSRVVFDLDLITSGPDAGRLVVAGSYRDQREGESEPWIDTTFAVWMAEPDGSTVEGTVLDLAALLGPNVWSSDLRAPYVFASMDRCDEVDITVHPAGQIVIATQMLLSNPWQSSFLASKGLLKLDIQRTGEQRSIVADSDWGTITEPGQQIPFVTADNVSDHYDTYMETGIPQPDLLRDFLLFHNDMHGIAIDDQGRVLASGAAVIQDLTHGGGDMHSAVVRLLPNGQPDPTFSHDGLAWLTMPQRFPLESTGESGQIHLLPDGRVVVAGNFATAGDFGDRSEIGSAGVMILTPDGRADPIFGRGSQYGSGLELLLIDHPQGAELPWQATQPVVTSSRITPDGKLLLGGYVQMTDAGRSLDHGDELIYFVGRILLEPEEDPGGGGGGGGGGGSSFDRNVTAEVIDGPGGTRILAVNGSEGANRILVRSDGNGSVQVLNGDAGSEDITGTFSLSDLDFIGVSGAAGNDQLTNELGSAFSGFVTLLGGLGNDALSGNGRYDRLFGDNGDDSLFGSDGDQLLFGGGGNDTLVGADGRDALWGGEGNDQISGGIGGDFIDGGAGDDLLMGQAGDDTLVGGAGNDSLNGDEGIDLLSYAERTEPITASLTSLVGGTEGESDAFDNEFEDILGGSGNDLLTGDAGRNRLFGAGGNDTLLGMGGKDQLFGGAGSDRLDGGDDADWLFDMGDGADMLLGGGGFDLGLGDSGDDDEQTERITRSLEEFLAAL